MDIKKVTPVEDEKRTVLPEDPEVFHKAPRRPRRHRSAPETPSVDPDTSDPKGESKITDEELK